MRDGGEEGGRWSWEREWGILSVVLDGPSSSSSSSSRSADVRHTEQALGGMKPDRSSGGLTMSWSCVVGSLGSSSPIENRGGPRRLVVLDESGRGCNRCWWGWFWGGWGSYGLDSREMVSESRSRILDATLDKKLRAAMREGESWLIFLSEEEEEEAEAGGMMTIGGWFRAEGAMGVMGERREERLRVRRERVVRGGARGSRERWEDLEETAAGRWMMGLLLVWWERPAEMAMGVRSSSASSGDISACWWVCGLRSDELLEAEGVRERDEEMESRSSSRWPSRELFSDKELREWVLIGRWL